MLAAPEQRDAALSRRRLGSGAQPFDRGLLLVVGGTHAHHLREPPEIVAVLRRDQGGVEGRSCRVPAPVKEPVVARRDTGLTVFSGPGTLCLVAWRKTP
jgi:hypothetical protein